MKRREYLASLGGGSVCLLAGCSNNASPTDPERDTPTTTPRGTENKDTGTGGAPFEHPGTLGTTFATSGEFPDDSDPGDGRPPAFPDPPDEPNVETSFDTISVNGETISLVPIDVAHAWYKRASARFVDARGIDQYIRSHIYGSVLSTAQQQSTGGGINNWEPDARVITYCGCPHHLSSLRAAGLQKAGFSNVFAIDEGFGEWQRRGYPMAGDEFISGTAMVSSEWTISGSVGPQYANSYVWAAVDRQYEAAPVQPNGNFEIPVKFWDVTENTLISITTPAYTVTEPIKVLSSGEIDQHGNIVT